MSNDGLDLASTGPIVKEGILRKQGHLIHSWKTRYFVLQGGQLRYYTDAAARAKSPLKPKGSFSIVADLTCSNVKIKKSGVGLQLWAGSQRLLLSCPSEAAREEWRTAVQTEVERVKVAASGSAILRRDSTASTSSAASTRSLLFGGLRRETTAELAMHLRPGLRTSGTLRVRVIAADNLLGKDTGGTSDPYVIIRVGSSQARTKVVKKELNPEWNEVFEFPFSRRVAFARVDVFDHDMIGKDSFLGRCLLPLSHVTSTPCQEWHPVGKRSTKSHVRGRIFLEFSTDLPRDEYLWKEFYFCRSLPGMSQSLLGNDTVTVHAHQKARTRGSTMSQIMAQKGAEALLTSMPPEQGETVEDMAEVTMRTHLGGARSEGKGTLFLTNYRLMFVSTSSVCTRHATLASRRTSVSDDSPASESGAGAGAGAAGSDGTRDAAEEGDRAGDLRTDSFRGLVEEPSAPAEVVVSLAAEAGPDTEFWARDLSTSVPLGHIATVAAGKDSGTGLDTVTILCKDFRSLVFLFPPIHNVPPPSSRLTEEEWHRAHSEDGMLGEIRRTRSATVTAVKSLAGETPRPASSSDDPSQAKAFFLQQARSSAAAVYARLYHMVINMSCMEQIASNLHADALTVLQGLREGSRQARIAASGRPPAGSASTGAGAGGGAGAGASGRPKAGRSRRRSLRRVESMSHVVVNEVNLLYDRLAVAWQVYQPEKELRRMGVPNSKWRVTTANAKYELCATYPAVLAVPTTVSDEHLQQGKAFRSKHRLPVLSWRHPVSGATITRSSQPMVGLGNNRSRFDESLLESIRKASKSPAPRLLIADARPKLNARANKTQGKGFESTGEGTAYPNCDFKFMDIGNIHVMRKALDSMRAVCNTPSDCGRASSFAGDKVAVEVTTGWLMHVSRVLTAALHVVNAVDQRGTSVLVHCSDGWDRTAQMCALAELLMDPYYRTITGFQVLIEREWLSFGHKFGDRCGWSRKGFQSSDRSPIFIQFLDCVFQLINQFPAYFEFDSRLLCLIADHAYSGWFGNFLYNCERERMEQALALRTLSLWALVDADRSLYENPHYRAPPSRVLGPVVDSKGVARMIWAQGLVLVPSTSVQRLTLWTDYYHRWDSDVRRYQWQVESMTGWAAQALRRDALHALVQRPSQRSAESASDSSKTGSCHQCSKSFTWFHRCKVCANCGNSFCTSCCSLQRHLAADPGEPIGPLVRVCADCASRIDVASPARKPPGPPAPARRRVSLDDSKVGAANSRGKTPPAPPPRRRASAAQASDGTAVSANVWFFGLEVDGGKTEDDASEPAAAAAAPRPGRVTTVAPPRAPQRGPQLGHGPRARSRRRPTSIGIDPLMVAKASAEVDDRLTDDSSSDDSDVDDTEAADMMEATLSWIAEEGEGEAEGGEDDK